MSAVDQTAAADAINLVGTAATSAVPRPAAAVVQAPADHRPRLADNATLITVTKGGSAIDHTCNAVAFSQIPGHPDLFLGRAHDYAEPGVSKRCVPDIPKGSRLHWLALYKMDWTDHTLNYLHDVLKPPFELAAGAQRTVQVENAFDPSVISYNGEIWAAFECGGKRFHGNAACMGPFDPATGTIHDLSRVTVIVEGASDGPNINYTASVPNLFVFHGKVYVYWSVIRIRRPGGPRNWLGVTVRGMELQQESGGLRRFWGAGSAGFTCLQHGRQPDDRGAGARQRRYQCRPDR